MLKEKFNEYYFWFRERILDDDPEIGMANEMKQGNSDSLGYASSWAWPFI